MIYDHLGEIVHYKFSVDLLKDPATGTRGSRAIRVDVVTRESFPQEPLAVLTNFLDHCHYAR